MKLIAALQSSPDKAVLLASLGVFLIYIELNRPGFIIAGAAGLLAVLWSMAGLLSAHPQPLGLALVLASMCVQIVSFRFGVSVVGAVGAGVITGLGCHMLFSPGALAHVHLPEAVLAGFLMGPGTSILTAIARRARMNKGLDS